MTKKIQLKPVELPDNLSWFFHPDLNKIDPLFECEEERGYTKDEWEELQDNGNIDVIVDTSISIEEIDPEGLGEWTTLKPVPPSPDHFLIAAFDHEYSEYICLWWAKQRDLSGANNG